MGGPDIPRSQEKAVLFHLPFFLRKCAWYCCHHHRSVTSNASPFRLFWVYTKPSVPDWGSTHFHGVSISKFSVKVLSMQIATVRLPSPSGSILIHIAYIGSAPLEIPANAGDRGWVRKRERFTMWGGGSGLCCEPTPYLSPER